MTAPSLSLLWPDNAADPFPFVFLAVYIVIGAVAAARTPIDRGLVRGAALSRANKKFTAIFFGYALALTILAIGSEWSLTAVLVFGFLGLVVGGFLAGMTIVDAEDGAREARGKMPAPVPLDLRTLNIDALQVTTPPYHAHDNGGLRLYRSDDKTVLALPRGSVAVSVLKHNGETLAKLVVPDRSNDSVMRGRRVAILGLDTTGHPFLLELPPEYADRSIDDCERWLLNAQEDDEVVAS